MTDFKVGDIVKMKMLHKGKCLKHYPKPMMIVNVINFYKKPTYFRCKYLHNQKEKTADVHIDNIELIWIDPDYAKLARMFLL